MEATNEPRVRANIKQLASGLVQVDITAETNSVDETGKLLGQAIDRVRKEVEAKGMKLVPTPIEKTGK